MFELSQNIDSNKIFIIQFSELEKRFDPDMVLYNRRVNSFQYKIVPLKSLLKKQPQYGANESGVKRNNPKESRYIRITDINEYGLLIDSIGVTAEQVENKYILDDNDILFARSGTTVGKAYLHQKENVNYKCFFAGYMIRFVVDENKILPQYLFTYTQLTPYKEWVKSIQRAAGQPNINAEEYKALLIPLPPISTQKNIIKIINDAYAQKQQKETQAAALLASIDDYLLEELGITLPEKDNSLQSRIFTTKFSELTEKWNPSFFKNRNQKIEGGIFSNYQLRGLALVEKGQSITKEKIIDGDYPVIAGGQTSPYNHSEYNVEGDCITISASGAYSGYVWYHSNPIFASDCSVIKSINEQIISNIFLSEVLKLKQSEIYMLQVGAAQPHVYPNDLFKLNIPLPPLEKQTEISKHIQNIRAQAKQLRQKVQDILEQAKKQVEQILLGE
ncbi:hypothetical protein EZS27_026349 [termite gut metagenome]|uniref:Type I restriction modification DNA specificity domain-containing protein n=1 Tax=termite gut metagenome TaxID=433724 RepID=A0A5J4QTA5_9ZZZZ